MGIPLIDLRGGEAETATRIAHDALIECVPACTGPDNPPRYAPITVGEYRAPRFATGGQLSERHRGWRVLRRLA